MKSKEMFAVDVGQFKQAFIGFLDKIDGLYKPDAVYHSSAHGVDVMSTTSWFMKSKYIEPLAAPVDHFMTLIAAGCHDVGHPGVNNLFLTKTQDPLALRYNDKSILESMHVALVFETMAADKAINWHGMLEPKSKALVRSGIIDMVMATDMGVHGNMVTKIKSYDMAAEDKQLKLILETVLHASDISNPAKAKANMLGWTKRVTAEFWDQGDREQKLNLPISMLCEREDGMKTLPKGQIGFINFVVLPYFNAILTIIPELQEGIDGLNRTKEYWEQEIKDERTFTQIFADVL